MLENSPHEKGGDDELFYGENGSIRHLVLSKHQKIALVALSIFGVFIIFAWFIQLKKSIHDPLASYTGTSNQSTSQSADCPGGNCNTSNNEALKTKDTDGDGLSDYDELYNYKTSPYLEDSDSDGAKDGDEVKKNTDPNCPAGKQCNKSVLNNGDATTLPQGSASSTTGESLDTAFSELSAMSAEMNTQAAQISGASSLTGAGTADGTTNSDYTKLMSGNYTASELRTILINQGLDKSLLDKFNDEQLMSAFKDVMSNK